MYCSSCGSAMAQNLSYCNRCGAKVSGVQGEAAIKSSDLRPETLVASMVALFIFGLGAIALLIGVLKQVADFDSSILLAITMLSFMLMIGVEGVLIGLLLKGRRGASPERLKKQTTNDLREANAGGLPEAAPSVTEHTTRSFEPIYKERQSE